MHEPDFDSPGSDPVDALPQPGDAVGARSKSPEWLELLRLGWPMMATQFFIMATGFLDTVMAGRYGAEDLAGVSLGGNLLWPFFMLLTGVTMALTPIVSQLRGSGSVASAGHRVRQALWIAAVASVLLVVILRFAAPLYAFFGIQGEMAQIAVDYLRAVSWGIPAVVFYVALRQVFEGLGQTRLPMLIAGLVVPINGVLNYAFIYGEFGFPQLGGVGCGWATAIVFWLELLAILYFVRRPFFRETTTFAAFEWPQLKEQLRLLRIGLPIGLTVFLEIAVFAVMGIAVGRMGVIDLAAHSVAGNLNWLTYVLPAGLGAAASIRVGYFVGAGDLAQARRCAVSAYAMALIYGILVSGLLLGLRHVVVGAYTTDPAVIEIALTLLLFVAFYQIVDDTNVVAVGALRGFKDTQAPMYYGLFGFWVIAVPLGSVLAFGWPGWAPALPWSFQPFGVYGYWIGLTLGIFLVAVAVSIRLYKTSGNEQLIRRLAAG